MTHPIVFVVELIIFAAIALAALVTAINLAYSVQYAHRRIDDLQHELRDSLKASSRITK